MKRLGDSWNRMKKKAGKDLLTTGKVTEGLQNMHPRPA